MAGYTYTHKHSWPNQVRVDWLRCPGIAVTRKCSATVVSANWAIVDGSCPKGWNWCAQADLHFLKNVQAGDWFIESSPNILVCEEKATSTMAVSPHVGLVCNLLPQPSNEKVGWFVTFCHNNQLVCCLSPTAVAVSQYVGFMCFVIWLDRHGSRSTHLAGLSAVDIAINQHAGLVCHVVQ